MNIQSVKIIFINIKKKIIIIILKGLCLYHIKLKTFVTFYILSYTHLFSTRL